MAYHSCKNCNHPFGTTYKYCPNCGLKQSEELSLKVLFNNTIQNYLAFDARFFHTVKPLLFKPGFLPKEFINGKRLTYLHPAQLYLFTTIIFFFIFSFQVDKIADEIDSSLVKSFSKVNSIEKNKSVDISSTTKNNDTLMPKEIENIKPSTKIKTTENSSVKFDFRVSTVDSLIKLDKPDKEILKVMGLKDNDHFFTKLWAKQLLKFYKNPKGGSIYKRFISQIPIALFFLLPLFAILLYAINFKYKGFVKHLIFTFYYFAFIFFVLSLKLVLNYIYKFDYRIDIIFYSILFIYLIIAIKKNYNRKWISAFFKSLVLSVSFLMLILPFTLMITLLISFMFY